MMLPCDVRPMKYDPAVIIAEDDNVYPPSEDSILLIQSFDVKPFETVLEIGCGSGVVAVHCARNGANVIAADINPYAAKLAKKNAEYNNVEIDVRVSDLFQNIPEKFDTIVFNLPYLPVDDAGELAKAWSGGKDGMGPLPRLIEEAPDHLNTEGRLVIVVSSLMDREKLHGLLDHCKVDELSNLPLFFEKLRVLEIKP